MGKPPNSQASHVVSPEHPSEAQLEQQKLLTTTEAAEFLRVSASYLNKLRLTRAGPPFVKLGTRVAYSPSDLANFVEASKHESTAPRRPAVL